MKITPTCLPGVLMIDPIVHRDGRGYFIETFNQRRFNEAVGHEFEFVQDNHSRSVKGVLRGLHYQAKPHAQGKLVRVAQGEVFDVAADVDPASATFGRWFGVRLSAGNHRQLWIPPGYAHGFLVLSVSVDFLYKTTAYYEPAAERAVRWNDPMLAIDWPLDGLVPTLSTKDSSAPALRDIG